MKKLAIILFSFMLFPILSLIFLAAVLCALAFIIYGVMQLWVWAWGRKRYGKEKSHKISLFVAISLASLPALLLVFNEVVTPSIEWNPYIKSSNAISGEWRDEEEVLTLKANGTYEYSVREVTASGSWSREDWNVRFSVSPNMPYTYLRAIEHSDQYHLIKDTEHRDPDIWAYNNGFSK